MNSVSAWGSTKHKRALAEDVAYFCIERLMPRMKSLEVCIMLTKGLEVDGYCLSRTPREFELEIDSNLTAENFISCVCHEMVHVKQHARKELKDDGKFFKKWKGEEILGIYSTTEEYMNLPWEKEAYELQEILTNEFISLKNNQKRVARIS